jgi:predicted amidohydrolase
MDSAMVMVVGQLAELTAFDPDARLERACELIVDAGQARARWICFPEGYLPGAPAWLWAVPHDDTLSHELHARALAAAVTIPGAVSDRLCRLAQRSHVGVVIGLIERDNDTCYSSLLVIDARGCICGHYRSLLSATIWSSIAAATPVQMEQMQAQLEWTGGI